MPGAKFITHKGVEVLYADYRGCKTEEEMLEVLQQVEDIVAKLDRPYLQLADMRGVFLTPGYIKRVKEAAKTLPQTAKKRAILGMDSLSKQILLRTYNMLIKKNKIVPFSTLEEALDWIVKD